MINIVFVSNYFNHHEKFFCDELSRLDDVNFKFIQTTPIPKRRMALGYQDLSNSVDYCFSVLGDETNKSMARSLCNDADALILGNAPYEFIADRVRNNKLTFFYAERLFRQGLWHMLYPPTFFTVLKRFIIPGRKSNFYLLAASGYTAWDTSRIFAFNDHRFKWGHLIEVPKMNSDTVEHKLEKIGLKHSQDVSILWAGRLIGWKHPDMSLRIAKTLKERGIPFNLRIIGSGELEGSLKKMISDYNLDDCVRMLGTMTPGQVRKFMEESDIYLFTSDFNEGWGAVLGEAMSSGCAVVTSHGIGATPFLAKHNENALLYETGNYESFERNVLKLATDPELRIRLGRNAGNTMMKLWNPTVGAERFHKLCVDLLEHKAVEYYDDGPLSKAEILKNNWFKDDTI